MCKGYDFNNGLDYDALLSSMVTLGFQATNLGLAMEYANEMVERVCPNNLSCVALVLQCGAQVGVVLSWRGVSVMKMQSTSRKAAVPFLMTS